jgi:hypothetical protein
MHGKAKIIGLGVRGGCYHFYGFTHLAKRRGPLLHHPFEAADEGVKAGAVKYDGH